MYFIAYSIPYLQLASASFGIVEGWLEMLDEHLLVCTDVVA
jgi:hypothetical protein